MLIVGISANVRCTLFNHTSFNQFQEKLAKFCHYDGDAMFPDWQQRQGENGRKVVSLSTKAHIKPC
ncbi:MAG: hypothetical protein ACK552_08335 [Microcystis sp.]